MKVFRIISRSIRDSFKSIFRNFSLSLASISCTVITLILVSLAILASYNVTSMTDKIERDLTMVVFVDNKATNEERKMLEIPYSILQKILNILTDDTLLTKEIFEEIEKDLDDANEIIYSEEYMNFLLQQPYGKEILDFLDKINKTEDECEIYNSCLEFKKIISN